MSVAHADGDFEREKVSKPIEHPDTRERSGHMMEEGVRDDMHRLRQQANYFSKMSSEMFAAFVRARISHVAAHRETIGRTKLFPLYAEMDSRVLQLSLLFEYVYAVLEQTPVQAWPATLVILRSELLEYAQMSHPQVQDVLHRFHEQLEHIFQLPHVQSAVDKILTLSSQGESEELYFEMFEGIKDVAQRLTSQEEPKYVMPYSLSLESYCDVFEQVDGVHVSLVYEEGTQWVQIILDPEYFGTQIEPVKLPLLRDVYYKGGASRLLIKLLAYAKATSKEQRTAIVETIIAELPFNDYDTCLSKDPDIRALMRITGEKDLAGFDWQKDGFDVQTYLRNRDSSINAATLGPDGFHYADIALASALAATTMPMKCDQGLFGHDAVVIDDVELGTSRTLERNMKLLIEGKVQSVHVLVADLKMQLGVFALVNAIRWLKKDREFGSGERSAPLLARLSVLLAKLGQYRMVWEGMQKKRATEQELADWPDVLVFLDMLTDAHPYITLKQDFAMHGKLLWIMKKAATRYVKDFKRQHGIVSALPFALDKTDQDSIVLNLTQNMPTEEEMGQLVRDITGALPEFLSRSAAKHSWDLMSRKDLDPRVYPEILGQIQSLPEDQHVAWVASLFQTKKE